LSGLILTSFRGGPNRNHLDPHWHCSTAFLPRAAKVDSTGIKFNWFVDGRIAEHHLQFDLAGLLVQVGAMSA